MNSLPPLPNVILGRYEHYKGEIYEVLGVARHSETLEPLVLYRPCKTPENIWVRPFGMFFEKVSVDNRLLERFRYLGPSA